MEFRNKQFDGLYEIAGVELKNEGLLFKGLIYFPPETYEKPHPLIVYFHGFPQIFPLDEIVKNYKYLLDSGYAFLNFNFRGYKDSQGQISIKSHVSDAQKIIKFIKKMAKQKYFDFSNINIIAHNFGAYIALILCSKISLINKLILLSPILDLERHVYSKEFLKSLHYINRFLPGSVRGIENIDYFINMTKDELSKSEFKIENIIRRLKIKKLISINGELDKITPISEVKRILNESNIDPEIVVLKSMEYDYVFDEETEEFDKEIKKIFT